MSDTGERRPGVVGQAKRIESPSPARPLNHRKTPAANRCSRFDCRPAASAVMVRGPLADPAQTRRRVRRGQQREQNGETMLSPQGRVVMVSGANRGLAVAHCLHGKGYGLSLGGR